MAAGTCFLLPAVSSDPDPVPHRLYHLPQAKTQHHSPTEGVESPSLEVFRSRLDKHMAGLGQPGIILV